MRARVHLIIAAHLCMSPRGQREAAVLQEAGHEVTVSGVWFDPERAELDMELTRRMKLRFRPALDIRPGVATAPRWVERAKGRWARIRFGWSREFSPALLGYGAVEQLEAARRVEADLTIVHSEAGLWVGRQLLREGRRVGVDFEDWFSRDLPEAQRAARPVDELIRLENTVLGRASYRVASSRAMANALARAYDVPAPAVVTNAGQGCGAGSLRRGSGPLRLHWLSQTIGPARGLELLFAALPLVRSAVRIDLRGSCSAEYRAWLQLLIPDRCRDLVTISPPVPPWELPARVAEHDVGLALETSTIASRNLCIPNKFFHYLASGLAVIASETAGHREALAPCSAAGLLVDESSPHELAGAIDRLANEPERLAAAKLASRAASLGRWSGENERTIIVAETERALAHDLPDLRQMDLPLRFPAEEPSLLEAPLPEIR